MAKIIGLPKLSPTMEEGTLVRWVKQEGEAVAVDDLIAEVETDKATMEFRSFDQGVLLKQLAPEGATLLPDQPVAIIGKKGEDITALLKQVGGGGGGKSVLPPKAPEDKAELPRSKEPPQASAPGSADKSQGAAPVPAEGDENERAQGRVFASPVVRKLAREKDIDLAGVRGSGPGGRVIMRDVDGDGGGVVGLPGAPLRGPSAPPPANRKLVAVPPAAAVPGAAGGQTAPQPAVAAEGDRTEKLSSMRKTIARRLSESKREVPHFYLTINVDAESLLAARVLFNQQLASSGEKVSLNDFIIKACAAALRRMPRVNVSFAGDSVIYHEHVNISVAVAIPDGLVTPVVRDADRLGVLAISQTVRELAARAKDKKLKAEEMQGGTFSISNLGMYGIDDFSAVINPPEAAILAVGAVRDEPVVKNGNVVAGKRMALTMSCDHRVVDGALAAEWLKLLRSLLESPLSMLL
ncbi:MAG: Dihydrolipoyllysine-residue acetyltransferase [Myxococcaceae bacterium]|nr:Dihydrolipoyllysine-residue acetyltransferase [Myxococcaceae bacterium]